MRFYINLLAFMLVSALLTSCNSNQQNELKISQKKWDDCL